MGFAQGVQCPAQCLRGQTLRKLSRWETGGALSAQSWPLGRGCWKLGPKSTGVGVLGQAHLGSGWRSPCPRAPELVGRALAWLGWGSAWRVGERGSAGLADTLGMCVGRAWDLALLWAGPLASSSHPAHEALTDDCRGQAGWLGAGLGAGFPARQGLWGPCVLGVLPTLLHSLPWAPGLVGAGTWLPVALGCVLSGLRVWGARVFLSWCF